MPATQIQSITQPNYFRSGINLSGADIAKNLILKAGATSSEIALATAVTDNLVGVSTETMFDQKTQSFQREGRAVIVAGAAISVNANVTTDSQGRAVTATQAAGAQQRVIGMAVTAAAQAGDLISVELQQFGIAFNPVMALADRPALKAIGANDRFDGMTVLLKTDNSLWRFNSTAVQAADAAAGSEQFVIVPTAGTGRWHRADKAFVANFAFDFNMADATALCTVPEGFTARLGAFPWWEVATAFTGGASSAIGVSTNKASYNTKGDILGGAAGDVAAGLTAGIKLGTIGAQVGTLALLKGLLWVEGDTLRFDRITSAFTAGVGAVRVPLIITSNDSPLTP